nr:hypothetical protein [Porphyromonas gingivalis]
MLAPLFPKTRAAIRAMTCTEKS